MLPERATGPFIVTAKSDCINWSASCENDEPPWSTVIVGFHVRRGSLTPILYNSTELRADTKRFNLESIKVQESVTLLNKNQIFISSDAQIYPGVVINAEKGPVIIDRNAIINANSYLEGPLYIGVNTEIKPLSKIYNSSIHHTCKAGGEISGSVMLEFCNKGHDGFLGSSILGSWTNIGAGSNTSNLKNNYGLVEIHYFNERIKTDTQYLGTILGDHSKVAIQTRFNTGTIAGVQSNIFNETIPPKWIPSFSWGNSGETRYELGRSIETAKTVMARRNVAFDSKSESLFKKVHELALKKEHL